MYGKSYESMYEGSMIGAGINVFAVWNYIITKARGGAVEVNPKLLAFTLGGKEEDVVSALDFLQQPDPISRSKLEGGRRLLKEGQFQYRVVNWEYYQMIRNEEDKREYNRVKQAEFRAKRQVVVAQPAETTPRPKHPTLEEIKLQASKIALPDEEAEKFFNYYESNGWRVGRNPMKVWTRSLSNWKMNTKNYGTKSNQKPNPRNVGVIVGPTDYGKATPRFQREREAADKLAMVGQVAPDEDHPSEAQSSQGSPV